MPAEARIPFAKSSDEWTAAHPARWIATTERQNAVEFISEQTRQIVSAQVETANRVVASQERVASGIDKIAVGVDRVADGLEGLASAFDWGLSEMVWQLEQERTLLVRILEVLQAPLDTQAKELKKKTEVAYRNGWIDDAIEDFSESEKKNRYDFTIHQSLGNIYLFHKKAAEKALEYYGKAVKYATPESPYHASIALLHIGLVEYLRQDFEKAYEATSKAIGLSPNLHEAHFQCAQYCAKLGKHDEAIEHLAEAIQGDRNYCLKAESEKDFDPMRDRVQRFFEDLRRKAQEEATAEIEQTEQLVRWAQSCGVDESDAREEHDTAMKLLKRGSLFDCRDAIQVAWQAQETSLDSTETHLTGETLRISEEIGKHNRRLEGIPQACGWILASLFVCAVVVFHIIYAIHCFVTRDIIEGVLVLLLALPINLVIMGTIGGGLFYCVGFGIAWSVCKAATATFDSQRKQKSEQLQNQLAEVKKRRGDLNWEYRERGEDR